VSETPFNELPKEIKRKSNKIMQLNVKITVKRFILEKVLALI